MKTSYLTVKPWLVDVLKVEILMTPIQIQVNRRTVTNTDLAKLIIAQVLISGAECKSQKYPYLEQCTLKSHVKYYMMPQDNGHKYG